MSDEEQLREGVRSQLDALSERLECGGDVERQQHYKNKLIQRLTSAPVAIHTDKPNEQHYEVDTDFFKLVLDKRMKYSCALWNEGITDLDTAQEEMLRVICERAEVRDGQRVMDLGCGWGALGLYICQQYPRCHVLCLSNSNTQRQHIQREAARLGYTGRLRVITADAKHYDNPQHHNSFDRIISIEMFEHMRNYSDLLSRVSSWLTPAGGKLFTQILCHARATYVFNTSSGQSSASHADGNWMANNFFTGGTMPSADLLLYFQKHVLLEHMWIVNGRHYTRTLDAWLSRLHSNMSAVRDVLSRRPGDNASRQVFNWRMFFILCSEVFGYGQGNHWLVAHHLFTRRPPAAATRITPTPAARL